MADVIGRAVIEIVPDFSKFRKELSQTTQNMTRDMSNQMGKANISGPMSKTFGDAGRKASAELKTATDKGFKGIEDSAKAAGTHIERDMKSSFDGVGRAAAGAGSKIDKEMDQAARQAKGSADKAGAAWKGSMGGIGGAIGGVAAVASVVAFTKSSVDSFVRIGTETRKLTRFTGESAEEMSKLRYAASTVGVQGDQLANGFKFLNKNTQKSKTGFNEAGVALFDLSGKQRSASEIFLDTADKLKGMTNASEKTAIAQKIFGRAGTDLLPILNKGREGISSLGAEAEKFGLVMSGKQLDDIVAYKKSQRELTATFDGLKVAVGSAVLPILTKFLTFIVSHLLPVITAMRDYIGTKLVPILQSFADKMKPVTDAIGKVVGALVGIAKANAGPIIAVLVTLLGIGLFGALSALVPLITGLFAGIGGLFAAATGPILLVVGAFVLLYTKVKPFKDAVDGLVKSIADTLIPIFREIVDGVQAFVNAFIDGGDEITSSGFAGFLEGLGVTARNIFDEIKGGITAFVKAFVDGGDDITSSGFAGFLEGLGVIARNAFDMIKLGIDYVTPAVNTLIDVMKGILVQPLLDGFKAVSALFSGDFSGAMDIAKEGLGNVAGKITELPGAVLGLLDKGFDVAGPMLAAAKKGATSLVDGLVDSVKDIPVIGGLGEALGGLVSMAFDSAGGWMDIIHGIFTLDGGLIADGANQLKDYIITGVTVVIPGLLTAMSDLFSDIIPNALDGIGDSIKDIPILGSLGTTILDTIKTGFDIAGNIADVFAGIFTFDGDKIKEGLGGIISAIGNFLIELPGKLIDYVGDAGEIFAKFFGIAVDWLVNNLPTVFAKLKDLPEMIGTFISGLFGGGKKKGKEDKNAGPGFFGGLIDSAKNWITTEAGPQLGAAFKMFITRIPPILLKIVTGAAKLLAVVVPGLLGVLFDWAGDILGALPGIIVGLGKIIFNLLKGLGGFLFDGMKWAFNWLVENLPGIISTVLNWLMGLPMMFLGVLGDLGGLLLGWLTTAFNWLVENGPGILATLLGWVLTIPTLIVNGIIALGGLLFDGIKLAFGFIVEKGPDILLTLLGWVLSIPGMIVNGIIALGGLLFDGIKIAFGFIVEKGPDILLTLLGWILTIPTLIVNGLIALGGLLFDGIKIAFDFIVTKGPEVLATVVGWVTGVPATLLAGLGAIGDKLFDWAKAGFDLVKEKGPELLTGLLDFFKGIPGKLVDALGGAATGAFNFAAKIFNALRGFINDKLIKKLQNISVFGAKPFAGLPEVPDIPLAQGGIITKATNALIGEDGAEVVIPLTKPERAKELLVQSGLMNILTETATNLSSVAGPTTGAAGIAMSAVPSTPDTAGITSTVTTSMTNVVDSAIVALQPVKDWFVSLSAFAVDSLKTFGETVWAGIQVTFQFLVTQILTLLESLTAYIALWPMTISALLANTGGLIWLSMAGGMGVFAASFKAVFADLSVYVTTWKTGLEAGFGALPAFMGGIAGQITSAVATPFRTFASSIWNPFATTLTGALDQIPATANINIPSLTFPTAHEGGVIGEMLPETSGPLNSSEMLVKMQRGEGVIPASVMSQMSGADFEYLRQGDFGERDPRLDSKIAAKFAPQYGGPVASIPMPTGGGGFDTLPASILDGLKLALTSTFTQVKALTEQAFYAPKYLGGVASSAAMGGLAFVQEKFDENNKAVADAMGGVGTAFPNGFPPGLPAAIDAMRQVAGKPGSYPALINYMEKSGVPFKAISTSRPGATTRGSGNTRASLHASNRAVDFAGLKPSVDSPQLLAIYRAFEPVRDILQELIYSGPGGGLVRNPITRADHHNHVHAGLANGAYVQSRMMAMLGEDGPEVVIPLTRPMRALQLAEQSGLLGVLSQAAGQRAATQGDTTTVPTGSGATGSVEVQGLFPGQGNTYNIYGISMAQVIAEIEAREQASTRVNFTRR